MISLDGIWEFQHDPTGELTSGDLTAPRPIAVPSPWQAQFPDLHLTSGVGWYRRSFDVPAEWRSGVVLLRFGAVDYYAEVWLNGTRLGDHEGGYLPFAFEVQDHLVADRPNELLVRVIDPGLDTAETFPAFRFSEIPHGKQNWYGPLGGIWQSVVLEQRGRSYVRELRLTPNPRAEQVTVECAIAHPTQARLEIRILAPSDQVVATAVATESDRDSYSLTLPVAAPDLWDLDRPALYQAEVEIVSNGTVVDRASDTFGFRTIEAQNGEIRLNGRPIYLRGALDQDYYPGTIATPPSDEFIRDRFTKAKELGLNCLRCHIKAPDPRYYAWADRLGLLIWTDLPSWAGQTRPKGGYGERTALATKRAVGTLEGMIRRDWNHPSLVCWSIVNEDWGTKLSTSAEDRAWLRATYDWAKGLDPYRLVVDNSACVPNFHVKSDLDDYHFYRAIPDHAERWTATIDAFANRPAWSYSPHGDAVRTGAEPLVVSEFGNWGLPNVEQLLAAYGGEPWWFATGDDWGRGRSRGIVHPHGVLDRFAALGLGDVFGSYAAFVTASQEQEHDALAFEIGEMRRHASIKGYVITELTDVHWECNGLLDLCNNPKSFQQTLALVNADDVVVLEPRPAIRRAFWSGESVVVAVTVSHFSRHELGAATIRWHLELPPSTGTSSTTRDVSGTESGLHVDIGQTTSAGEIRFAVPEVAAPARASLRVELVADDDRVVACNDLDLYLFPRALQIVPPHPTLPILSVRGTSQRRTELAASLGQMGYLVAPEPGPDGLIVSAGIDEELVTLVEAGARALAIVEDAATVTADLASLEVVEREGTGYDGDWASNFNWLYANRFQHRIPAGPRLDWAFATVAPEQVILGLTAEEIARDALAGLYLGWIQKPGALALQTRLGRGTLLVTTLRLAQPRGNPLGVDPVATVLCQDLLEHLATGSP